MQCSHMERLGLQPTLIMLDLKKIACCFKHAALLPELGGSPPPPSSCLLQGDKEAQIKFTIKTDVYQPERVSQAALGPRY